MGWWGGKGGKGSPRADAGRLEVLACAVVTRDGVDDLGHFPTKLIGESTISQRKSIKITGKSMGNRRKSPEKRWKMGTHHVAAGVEQFVDREEGL